MDERGDEHSEEGQAEPWHPPGSSWSPPGDVPPGQPYDPAYPPVPPVPPTSPYQPTPPMTYDSAYSPTYTVPTNGHVTPQISTMSPPAAAGSWRRLQAALAPRVALRYRDRFRNACCAIGAAAGIGGADALMLPAVVVAAFVARVGGGNVLVALIPVIAALAWGLPGAIMGSVIANRPRLVTFTASATFIWAILVLLLALISLTQTGGTARALLDLFFTLYVVAAVAGGVALLAAERLPARITTRYDRPTLMRGRAYAATIATVVAALIGGGILAGDTPASYLVLFAVAALFLIIAAGLTLALVERAWRTSSVPRPPLLGLRTATDVLRLSAYRRYLGFRVFALFAAVAEPFYIVYAVRELHVTGAFVGRALLAVVLARAVTLALSRGLIRVTGTRLLLQLAALFRTLAATAAIALPAVWDTNLFGTRFLSDDTREGSFLIVFVCLGAALGVNAASQGGFLLDILPPDLYQGGIAFTNGVLAVLSIVLIAGGIIADRRGIPVLFAIAVALGVLAMLVGGFVHEPWRPRVQPLPGEE